MVYAYYMVQLKYLDPIPSSDPSISRETRIQPRLLSLRVIRGSLVIFRARNLSR